MPIHPLRDRAEYDAALAGDTPTIVFKHSPTCGTSYMALRVVNSFAERHPDVPVVMVDVINQRELSDDIADELGIRHESPQAIVTRAGQVMWSGSHGRISADALARSIAPVDSVTADS